MTSKDAKEKKTDLANAQKLFLSNGGKQRLQELAVERDTSMSRVVDDLIRETQE